MKLLTREDILAAPDIATERVPVPEWGGEVIVKGLSGRVYDDWQRALVEGSGKKAKINLTMARAKLCALAVVDKDNKRIFSDTDLVALNAKCSAPLARIYKVVSRLSGLDDEELEEVLKNSETIAENVSGID